MRITITARHTGVDDDLRALTRELVERVVKLVRRPHHAQVTFSEEHDEAGVEIEVHVPRGRVYVAKSHAADHRSALDAAIARMKRLTASRRSRTVSLCVLIVPPRRGR